MFSNYNFVIRSDNQELIGRTQIIGWVDQGTYPYGLGSLVLWKTDFRGGIRLLEVDLVATSRNVLAQERLFIETRLLTDSKIWRQEVFLQNTTEREPPNWMTILACTSISVGYIFEHFH